MERINFHEIDKAWTPAALLLQFQRFLGWNSKKFTYAWGT